MRDSLSPQAQALLSVAVFGAYSLTLVACIAAAVFYAGAVSPELVARKTLVYGGTVALLVFTLATVQALVTDALVDWLGVTDRLGSAMVGTVFGLAFHPLSQGGGSRTRGRWGAAWTLRSAGRTGGDGAATAGL